VSGIEVVPGASDEGRDGSGGRWECASTGGAGLSQNRDQWPIYMAETKFMGRAPDSDDPITNDTSSTVCLCSAALFSTPELSVRPAR